MGTSARSHQGASHLRKGLGGTRSATPLVFRKTVVVVDISGDSRDFGIGAPLRVECPAQPSDSVEVTEVLLHSLTHALYQVSSVVHGVFR
ncbi:hypothetical protein FHR84_003506 [Actinopolyspora biskrensis]|uniref:Uncharacterized protein n=1 Tax=Actinopolyspora biskrensis TaxID=1470178 RepID=A0A852ZBX9_9ACTN|nr:hypothetical protein [Actinopolyspora biskrensis]